MSLWTHIAAVIDVDTYIESHTIQADVEALLEDAPKITGSEGPAEVFVNVLSGWNRSTNCDCGHCEFYGGDDIEEFVCRAKPSEGDVCPEAYYQTRVVITVLGDLRDRMRGQTKSEWLEFKKHIAEKVNGEGFTIRNCACTIRGW